MKSKEEAVRHLVEYHVAVEAGIIAAFWYIRDGGDNEKEPLKILEISRDTVPAGVVPIYFGATKETPYPVVIIELTEEEFRGVGDGSLTLPLGWDRAEALHRLAA